VESERHCSKCGQRIPDDVEQDICPQCLLRLGLESESEEGLAKDPTEACKAIDGEPDMLRDVAHCIQVTLRSVCGWDYELLGEIARGGMGVVYKARQVSLDRIVAVKMILGGPHASEAFIKRFEAEAKAAARLKHPNIVAVHEVGEHEGQPYFSMDFVDGPSLAKLVRDNPLSARKAARYIQIIAEAIHFAHQHHILHRDLKPSNVLVDSDDQPRITDFGLAKRMDVDSSLSSTGHLLGTPGYMPPEQVENRHGEVGPHSDVYSIGATLYHLLTGRPPFQGENLADVLAHVRHVDPVLPRVLNPSVPRDLETICMRCMKKDVVRRYGSAEMLAQDLGRWARGEPILARPSGRLEYAINWFKRKLAAACFVLALGCAVIVRVSGAPWQ
jgi:eukaryotic-like serine/threonine-protein kinase